jgi:hypothetical protein
MEIQQLVNRPQFMNGKRQKCMQDIGGNSRKKERVNDIEMVLRGVAWSVMN